MSQMINQAARVALLGLLAAILLVLVLNSAPVLADATDCATTLSDNDSIQVAVDDASPGETICLEDGHYDGGIIIDKEDLTLAAADGASPVIEEKGFHDENITGIRVRADAVSIEGITVLGFHNAGIQVADVHGVSIHQVNVTNNGWRGLLNDPGIRVQNATDTTISHTIGYNNGLQTVHVRDGSHGTIIKHSEAYDNDRSGFYVRQSNNVKSINNTAIGNGLRAIHYEADGIQTSDGLIQGTKAIDNDQSGILLVGTANMTVEDNQVEGNDITGDGRAGISVGGGDNNTIHGNEVEHHRVGSTGPAIRVIGSDDAVVTDNTVHRVRNDHGVTVQSGQNIEISNNEIANSDDGIHIQNDASNVVVDENKISSFDEDGISVFGDEVFVTDNEIEGARLTESGIRVAADDAAVSNNEVRNTEGAGILVTGDGAILEENHLMHNRGPGMYVPGSDAAPKRIANNIFQGNADYGALLEGVDDVTIENNAFAMASQGESLSRSPQTDLHLYDTHDLTVSGNDFVTGITIDGTSLDAYRHDISTDNTIGPDNRPVYHATDVSEAEIHPEAGQVLLANVTQTTIHDHAFDKTSVAIRAVDVENLFIDEVTFDRSITSSVDIEDAHGVEISDTDHQFGGESAISIRNGEDVHIADSIIDVDDWNRSYANGIALQDVTDASINDVTVLRSSKAGIKLHESEKIDVDEAVISDGDRKGIALTASDKITITNSTIQHILDRFATTYGLYADDASELTVSKTDIGGNDDRDHDGGEYWGMALIDSDDVWVSDSTFWGNERGIHLDGETDPSEVVITDSAISGSATAGVTVSQSNPGSTINDTIIHGNVDGIVHESEPEHHLSAINNWWGASNGPGGNHTGDGDTVDEFVDFDPYLSTPPEQVFNVTIVDPRAEGFDVETAKAGDTVHITAEVEHLGSEEDTQKVQLVDERGKVVDQTEVTLEPGESADKTFQWEPDTDDVHPFEYDRRLAVRSANAGDHVSVELHPDTEYLDLQIGYWDQIHEIAAGEEMLIELDHWLEPGEEFVEKDIRIIDPHGDVVDEHTITDFAGVEYLAWTPEETDMGAQTVHAVSNDTSASFGFQVVEEGVEEFTIYYQHVQHSAVEGDSVAVEAGIWNVGSATGTQTVKLRNPAGETVDMQEATFGPHDFDVFDLSWDTELGDAGMGEVEIVTENETITETVDIAVHDGPVLDIINASETISAEAGEALRIFTKLENSGTQSGEQDVKLTHSNGTQLDSQPVDLDADDEEEIQLVWHTDEAAVGEHTLIIETEHDSTELTVTIEDPDKIPALPGIEFPPQDLTGDGLYEDVLGTDEVTFPDAIALAQYLLSDQVQSNAEAFDFIENNRVSFADAIELAHRVAAGVYDA